MSKTLSKPETPSPFFELLADAHAIQVQEAPPGEDSSGRVRSFVVHITSPVPPPTPAATTPAADAEPIDAQRIAESAELLLESNDYVLARNLFSHVLNENLKDARALRGLGVCLFHLSDRVSARRCFKAWHELHNSQEALYWLGKSFAMDGDAPSALVAFGRINDTSAFRPEEKLDLFKTSGTCYAKVGEYRLAEQRFRAGLEAFPENDSLWVNMGSLEIQKGNPDLAQRYFRNALQAQGNNPKAYCGMGLVALADKNTILACAYFHKALELDPENWLSLEQWASTFRAGSDFRRLELHLLKFLEMHPGNAEGLSLAADLYDRHENRSEAQRYLKLALEADPKNVRALLVKGRTEEPKL